jgi:hypothetical protein
VKRLIAALCVCAGLAAVRAEEPKWTPLFNGLDLTGWKQQGKGEFRVEDGCLVGTQTDGQGGDLFTTNTWRNLEIRFAYKMKWPGNSGLWFRDQYQFDILQYANPVAFSGTLYCPSKMFLFRNTDAAREQRDGWNQARILAYGDHLAMWLNGTMRCGRGWWARSPGPITRPSAWTRMLELHGEGEGRQPQIRRRGPLPVPHPHRHRRERRHDPQDGGPDREEGTRGRR